MGADLSSLKNMNTLDEIPLSCLHRNDNFLLNGGEENGTASPSHFPPPKHHNLCHSERREESQAHSTHFMIEEISINDLN